MNAPTIDRFTPTPTKSAGPPDLVTREKPLAILKKEQPARIAELDKQGHFIESEDGKLYAYADVTRSSGPSLVSLIDAATGKALGRARVNAVVGPLFFTKDGVASREAGGKVIVRVVFKQQVGFQNNALNPG
jgi:hypothetical protein